jgi:outer membrane biosynthesis protein TonB
VETPPPELSPEALPKPPPVPQQAVTPPPKPAPLPPLPAPVEPPKLTTPLPLPPPPVPPPPAPPSTTAQPNIAPRPAPETKELLSTLERLRAQQQQTEPPKARPNPPSGGAPNAGGSLHGSDTALLTAEQRAAIGDHVRECWTRDAGAKDADKLQVYLAVTTDAEGVVREVRVGEADQGRLGDPVFRAFFERARRAVLDPRCANLPLPPAMLGQIRNFDFRFRP